MATAYAQEVELDSPLVWWRLGESAGTAAADNSSSGANDGTYVNAPTLGVADSPLTPADGTSVTFNGTDEYVVGDAAVDGGDANGFGLECWFKATNLDATRTILQLDRSGSTSSLAVVKIDTSGNVLVVCRDASALTFAAGVTAAAWHRLFVQVERTVTGSPTSTQRVTVWYDGAAVGSAQTVDIGTTLEFTNATLNVARNADASEYFAGTIKDVAYYNPSLIGTATVGRPAAHYAAATATSQGTPLACLVKIAGTDRTANVDAYSVRIVEAVNAGPSTAEFVCFGITPEMDQAVLIGSDGYSGADLLFSGNICGFTRQIGRKNQRTVYRVRARGLGYQPKLVRETYTEQTPYQVLRDLVYYNDYGINDLGFGAAPNTDAGSWTFINKPLSECFDELAKWCSGYWFVRADDGVWIITAGQTPGVTLSAATTHWRDFTYDTGGEPIRDYVRAEGATTTTLQAVTDTYVPVADASVFSTSGGVRIGTSDYSVSAVDFSRDTTTTSNDENAGSTTIEVGSTASFSGGYGWCRIAGVLYKYNVVNATTLALFSPGLVADTKAGALVQEADWLQVGATATCVEGAEVAQYATAGTGDNEYFTRATNTTPYAALDALADAELRTAARVSGSFVSEDDNARVGRRITVSMSSEWGISGTYIAERVEIGYERGRTRPQFRVSFGSVSATADLYAVFRKLLSAS